MSVDSGNWYVGIKGQILGPYTLSMAEELIVANTVSINDLILKEGATQWHRIVDTPEFKACIVNNSIEPRAPTTTDDLFHGSPKTAPEAASGRRSDRLKFEGSIIMHDRHNVLVCESIDVSKTGLFVEVNEFNFQVGQSVRLTIRSKQAPEPILVNAKIVRQSAGEKPGYGLQFDTDLDESDVPMLSDSSGQVG